jgi:multicomponent Na+:H+ antiporter subunit F
MSAETICLLALVVGAFLPSLALTCFGSPVARLVGLELVGAVLLFAAILFSQVPPGRTSELDVPLMLAPLSFAGILVFTRLLAPGGREGR